MHVISLSLGLGQHYCGGDSPVPRAGLGDATFNSTQWQKSPGRPILLSILASLVTFHFLPSVYEITLLQTERTWAVFVAGNGLDLFPLGKGVVVVRMAYGPLVHETPR